MATRRLTIKETNRGHPIWVVKPTDFICEAGPEIDPQEVLRDPKRFSLYCIDPDNDSVLFVESSDPVAVDLAPFYYQAQVEHAVGLVSMPIEVFHRVAAEIPEPPKGLIFIHSVGRCGSTLLSKVLAANPSIHSLSEPDDLTQIVNLRGTGAHDDEWLRQLIVSSTKWRCKPRVGLPAERVAIKTRSEVLVLADLLGPAFRHSKHFFLYRDGVSWMRSLFKGYSTDRDPYDVEANRKMAESWAKTLPLAKECWNDEAPLNQVQIRVLAWITCMEGYLQLREMGIPIAAARFEDLTTNPLPILEQFFSFCEIEDVDWAVIQEVLSRDSQAGTIYDREQRSKMARQLPEELAQDVRQIIATRLLLGKSDVMLPGTMQV